MVKLSAEKNKYISTKKILKLFTRAVSLSTVVIARLFLLFWWIPGSSLSLPKNPSRAIQFWLFQTFVVLRNAFSGAGEKVADAYNWLLQHNNQKVLYERFCR